MFQVLNNAEMYTYFINIFLCVAGKTDPQFAHFVADLIRECQLFNKLIYHCKQISWKAIFNLAGFYSDKSVH